MRNWQVLLEAFVRCDEPTTPMFKHLRLTVQERHEALIYLLNQEFVEQAGTIHGEDRTLLYQATVLGKFMVSAGFTSINVKRRSKKEPASSQTLAQRVIQKSPNSVFDLGRAPLRVSYFNR